MNDDGAFFLADEVAKNLCDCCQEGLAYHHVNCKKLCDNCVEKFQRQAELSDYVLKTEERLIPSWIQKAHAVLFAWGMDLPELDAVNSTGGDRDGKPS